MLFLFKLFIFKCWDDILFDLKNESIFKSLELFFKELSDHTSSLWDTIRVRIGLFFTQSVSNPILRLLSHWVIKPLSLCGLLYSGSLGLLLGLLAMLWRIIIRLVRVIITSFLVLLFLNRSKSVLILLMLLLIVIVII